MIFRHSWPALLLPLIFSSQIRSQPVSQTGFDPNPPADVSIPANFPGNPIDFFDDYSWRLFLSMVWPADPSHPGAPRPSSGVDDPGSRVFETFKSNADTFQPNGAAPGSFDASAAVNPCGLAAPPRDNVQIVAFSKFEELQQAGFGFLVGPIVAQNGTYVRYLTGYNKLAYDHIVNNHLYLKATAPAPEFPNGAIVTKSSWVETGKLSNPNRFYRRVAWVRDPRSGGCVQRELALVGLHIIQKTKIAPQWTWSTFEQVDNVPDATPAARSFHDGTPTAMPLKNPYTLPTPQVPVPFNIDRVTPINSSTGATNARFQSLLSAQNSVWQFYRLVMTQWPVPGKTPQQPGDPQHSFPGIGATSAFANVSMETFDQKRISTGCMACHDDTRTETDFVWSVQTHAFDPAHHQRVVNKFHPEPNAALKRLRARLESAVEN